jgi:hypothetical protein
LKSPAGIDCIECDDAGVARPNRKDERR